MFHTRISSECLSATTIRVLAFIAGILLSPLLFAQAISPEAAKQLEQKKMHHVFVDVSGLDANTQQFSSRSKDSRFIYFSTDFPLHKSRAMAEKDREAGFKESYWLAGTPVDWQGQALKLPSTIISDKKPSGINVSDLSDAIKDNVDLQVIDLRTEDEYRLGHIVQARHIMPHQILEPSFGLSKQRWLILIDAGGAVGATVAAQLKDKGYPLTVYLRGGYPAWVARKLN